MSIELLTEEGEAVKWSALASNTSPVDVIPIFFLHSYLLVLWADGRRNRRIAKDSIGRFVDVFFKDPPTSNTLGVGCRLLLHLCPGAERVTRTLPGIRCTSAPAVISRYSARGGGVTVTLTVTM